MRAAATIIAFAAAVMAQQNYSSPLDMTIDPGSVDEPTKSKSYNSTEAGSGFRIEIESQAS